MQPCSFFILVGYSLWGGVISGRVRALNLTVPLGSGRVGSDDLGYGPGRASVLSPCRPLGYSERWKKLIKRGGNPAHSAYCIYLYTDF